MTVLDACIGQEYEAASPSHEPDKFRALKQALKQGTNWPVETPHREANINPHNATWLVLPHAFLLVL